MNSENTVPVKPSKRKRNLLIYLSVSLFVLYSIYSFAINPLYAATATNINYQLTALPTVLAWVFILIYIVSILIYVSVTSYSVYKFGFKGSIAQIIITCAAIIYLHVTDTLMIEVSYSYGLSLGEMLAEIFKTDSFANMMLRIMSDLVFYAVTVAVAVFLTVRSRKRDGDAYTQRFYPINKFFTFKNPMNLISFIVALYILGYLIGSDTIFLIKDASDTVGVLTVIGEYLIKIILGFISYVGMLFAFVKYDS